MYILRRRRQLQIPTGMPAFHFIVISKTKNIKNERIRRYHSSHDATVTRDCLILNNAYGILSILPHLILTYTRLQQLRCYACPLQPYYSLSQRLSRVESGLDQSTLLHVDWKIELKCLNLPVYEDRPNNFIDH